MLPWLWCRPAAVALIQPLAWEPPNAMGVAPKKTKDQKKKKLSQNKNPVADGFIGKFYQTFRVLNTYPSATIPKS